MSHFVIVYNTDVEERIKRVREYAAEHVYEPPPAPDHIEKFGVVMMAIAHGDVREVRCVYTHTRLPEPKPTLRMLSISFAAAAGPDDLPSPSMTEQIARLFGFEGDYLGAPHECECERPCPPNVVCAQELPA